MPSQNPYLPQVRRRKRNVPTTQGTVRSRAARRMPQRTPMGMRPLQNYSGNLGGTNPAAVAQYRQAAAGGRTMPGGQPGPVYGGGGQGGGGWQPTWQPSYRPGVPGSGAGDQRPGTRMPPGSFGGPGSGRPGPGGGGGGNQPPGGGGGGGGPNQGPGGGGGGTPGPGGPAGLPLDPWLMEQQRILSDALAGQLGQVAPQQALIAAMQAQQEARLGTNRGLDERNLLEVLAERGAMGGGVQRFENTNLATDYLRQYQDVANESAQGYSDLARFQSNAQLDYAQQWAQALAESAARSAADPYAVADQGPIGGGPAGGGRPRPRPRRGGGGQGGGGGGWNPTWQPDWRPQRRRAGGR